MTRPSITISLKIPPRLLERIPAAGNGRSRYILTALEEKLSRQQPPAWKPVSKRGRKLAALLAAGKGERGPEISVAEVERELRERRGRNF
jgi:hypothetical protein